MHFQNIFNIVSHICEYITFSVWENIGILLKNIFYHLCQTRAMFGPHAVCQCQMHAKSGPNLFADWDKGFCQVYKHILKCKDFITFVMTCRQYNLTGRVVTLHLSSYMLCDCELFRRCWSYIGRSSAGGQTLSIGNDCGRKGIVEHEFLHALGLYHEQTRYDRDDYVTINYENIRKG